MEKDIEIKTGCDRGLCKEAVGRQDRQLNTYDWLADVPGNTDTKFQNNQKLCLFVP